MNFHVFELVNELIRGSFEQVDFDFFIKFQILSFKLHVFLQLFESFQIKLPSFDQHKAIFGFLEF